MKQTNNLTKTTKTHETYENKPDNQWLNERVPI